MTHMHEGQVDVDPLLVRRLLASQHPELADLEIVPVLEHGTDHALFRLGDELVGRFPVIDWADGQAELEAHWLPRLAPYLPVDVAPPVGLGDPEAGYPFRWSVNPWLPGRTPTPVEAATERFGVQLGEFVRALQSCPTYGAGLFGSRGGPLCDPDRDRVTRESLARSADLLDVDAALAVWEEACAAPAWDASPVWFHGDLLPGNVLVDEHGDLSAVLDWGPWGVGDPACELAVCWTTLGDTGREAFREAVRPDAATWLRGRGWAVSISAVGIPYYRESVPAFAERGVRTIERVLASV